MACRWGTETTVGRCYALWQNYSNCVTSVDEPSACIAFRDDYFECLHGNRQVRAHLAMAGPQSGRAIARSRGGDRRALQMAP